MVEWVTLLTLWRYISSAIPAELFDNELATSSASHIPLPTE